MSLLSRINVPNLSLNTNVQRIERMETGKMRVRCEGCKEWIADKVCVDRCGVCVCMLVS